MNDFSYSILIRNLCDEYNEHNISLNEYLQQRKFLLNKIDQEFNGVDIEEIENTPFMDTVTFQANDITRER